MLEAVAYAWLAWCGLCLAAQLATPIFHRPDDNAYTNGLVVYIGPGLRARLTQAELEAVAAHELGHMAHGHNWRNLARLCFFIGSSETRDLVLEYQADDYAAAHGHGPALASALRKLRPFSARDRRRARRLTL